MFIVRGTRSGIRTSNPVWRLAIAGQHRGSSPGRQFRSGTLVAGLAVAAIALVALPAMAAENTAAGKSAPPADPAHEIANRFAEGDKPAAKRPRNAQKAVSETEGAQTSSKPKSQARPPISQTAPARLDPAERASQQPAAAATAAPAAPGKPANEADSQSRDAVLQKAYEEEMLARAKAEAEARARAELQREEQVARDRAAAQASANEKAERERQERDTAAKAEQARRALEEEKARIAREDELQHQRDAERKEAQDKATQREQESRRLTERLRAARQAREEERARKQAEAVEAEVRHAEQTRRTGLAMRKRADHLAMRLEANRRARLAAARQQQPVPAPAIAPNATSLIATGSTHEPAPAARAAESAASSTRATILIVMTPGNRGIRRWNKNADPMLCVEENCYISRGEEKPADRISRNKGFGPGIALGKRAGACSNQLACVFRDVDLGGSRAWMQPVDLRILRHDRRESRMVAADQTCAIVRGRLNCRQTVESDDYRAWIVPEAVAREAGPAALHDALSMGLGVSHAAAMRHD